MAKRDKPANYAAFDHVKAILQLTRQNASIGTAVEAGRVIERVNNHAVALRDALRAMTGDDGAGTPGGS